MIVVNPEDTTHNIVIIPRFYPTDTIVISLFNEATQQTSTPANTYLTTDGNTEIQFEYVFTENQNFQIKITEADEVVYRDKIFSTSQDPQGYKLTDNVYFS